MPAVGNALVVRKAQLTHPDISVRVAVEYNIPPYVLEKIRSLSPARQRRVFRIALARVGHHMRELLRNRLAGRYRKRSGALTTTNATLAVKTYLSRDQQRMGVIVGINRRRKRSVTYEALRRYMRKRRGSRPARGSRRRRLKRGVAFIAKPTKYFHLVDKKIGAMDAVADWTRTTGANQLVNELRTAIYRVMMGRR